VPRITPYEDALVEAVRTGRPDVKLQAAIPGVGLVLNRGRPAESDRGGVTADLLARS
jgi:hypothetical protein